MCKVWKNKKGLWLLPEGLSHSPTWTRFEFTEDINRAWVGVRPPRGVSEKLEGVRVEVELCKQRVKILDWVHDTILDKCETIEEAREFILDETIRLTKDVTR